MQLKDWMEKEGRDTHWVASKLKVPEHKVRRFWKGIGVWATEIFEIAKLTDGEVNINDWVKLEKAKKK